MRWTVVVRTPAFTSDYYSDVFWSVDPSLLFFGEFRDWTTAPIGGQGSALELGILAGTSQGPYGCNVRGLYRDYIGDYCRAY